MTTNLSPKEELAENYADKRVTELLSMTKKELIAAVENAKTETKRALQTVYDAMNRGQQKKIVKDEAVKTLFDLYGVEYSK